MQFSGNALSTVLHEGHCSYQYAVLGDVNVNNIVTHNTKVKGEVTTFDGSAEHLWSGAVSSRHFLEIVFIKLNSVNLGGSLLINPRLQVPKPDPRILC